jgi:hypothetical protein
MRNKANKNVPAISRGKNGQNKDMHSLIRGRPSFFILLDYYASVKK